MLFNSLQFLIFFPIVVVVHFALPHRWRWLWLLLASFYFYTSWEPVYGILLVITSVLDFTVAVMLGRTQSSSRRWLLLSISLVSNLGVLFFFKYYDFFAETLNSLFGWLSLSPRLPILDIILPIGISFYTLQTLGYTIDVFRRKIAPESHLGIFMLYVSFFPQLIAGPIERAGSLLPQYHRERFFDERRASSGLKLIAWGFFKKLVIADNLRFYVDPVYANPAGYTGWGVLIATYLFAFQLYCDFSAYSDIAIGCARILGIDFMENFRRPFLSRSMRELWQRWHISLSTWFRDYVYFPLGGSRGVSQLRADGNIFTVFFISGLWHGAQWTYIVFGILNGIFYILTERIRFLRSLAYSTHLQPLRSLVGILLTFNLFALTLLFFRASSLSVAFELINQVLHIGQSSITFVSTGLPQVNAGNLLVPLTTFVVLAGLMGIECLQESGVSFTRLIDNQSTWMRWTVYYVLVMVIVIFGAYIQQTTFIYFQF